MDLRSFGRRATIGYSLEALTNDQLDLDLLKLISMPKTDKVMRKPTPIIRR